MLPDVGTKEDLARYRLERAKEDLEDAKTLLDIEAKLNEVKKC